jgi:OOP family OmpA-OmpF porin
MNRSAPVALAITLMAATLPASALDLSPAWYIGGGIGSSWMDPDTAGTIYSVSDDQDFAWHLLGGYRIDNNFSVELAYTDLGKADIAAGSSSAGQISYSQTTLGVLWSPTTKHNFRPYFKWGVNYSDHNWDQGNVIYDDWSGFVGFGLERFFGDDDYSVRADFTFYTEDTEALNLSFVKYFSD